jgi:hypothetical protein
MLNVALLRQPQKFGQARGGGINSITIICNILELNSLLLRAAVVVEQGRGNGFQFCIAQQYRTGGAVYRQSAQSANEVFGDGIEQGMQRSTPITRCLHRRVRIADLPLPDDGLVMVNGASARAGSAEVESQEHYVGNIGKTLAPCVRLCFEPG